MAGSVGLRRLHEEEDILTFLPSGEPDVTAFKDVARRFGALRVALIGIEPPPGQAVFSADMLGRLDRLSQGLKNTAGVDRVVSLSTMTDLVPSAGGVEIRPLVPKPIPTDEATLYKLATRALSLSQVSGNIVSRDGKAALVLVFLADGASTRGVALNAQRIATAEMKGSQLYYGGAPFAGQAIYDATQVDVRHLTPISLLVFFAIVLISFRDWLAVVLSVGTVAAAGIVVTGGMGFFGQPFTVVSAMLPVVLFAAGSQYAIHILGRYYILRYTHTGVDAARQAVAIAGPPVTIAAAATALGFLSFMVMNVQPMRSFGLTCAAGIGVCWLLALTVLPAAVARWPRPSQRPFELRFLGQGLHFVWDFAQRRRVPVLSTCAVLLALFARYGSQITVRMEPSAFFQKGSPPAQAQVFLDTRFGGSKFLQVAVSGDVLDPLALRELERLSAFARSLPGVTQVQSITAPIAMVSEAMANSKGLPSRRDQIGNLMAFLDGEPSLKQLLDPDHRNALLHVRIAGDPRLALAGIEDYLAKRWPYSLRPPTLDEVADEAVWSLSPLFALSSGAAKMRHAVMVETLRRFRAGAAASGTAAASPRDAAAYRKVLRETLAGEDGTALPDANRAALLAALAQEGTNSGRDAAWVRQTLPGGMSADAAAVFLAAVDARMAAVRQAGLLDQGIDQVLAAAGVYAGNRKMPISTGTNASRRAAVELVLANFLNPAEPTRASDAGNAQETQSTLTGIVSGEPVLDRGFSRAVERNQWASLRVSLTAVFVLLLLSLRSVGAAVMCVTPAALSLGAVFGVLGFIGQPIDIGTSLVGSIVMGSGADFAMHYIWYLRRNPREEVIRVVGPILLITAVLLAVGLGVLVLGNSPPLRLFGGLAGAGLLLSAIFTFLLVPALTRTEGPSCPPSA